MPGKVYETRVLFEYLLYPQQVGTLTIDPVDITVVAQVVVQSRHLDPFFGTDTRSRTSPARCRASGPRSK